MSATNAGNPTPQAPQPPPAEPPPTEPPPPGPPPVPPPPPPPPSAEPAIDPPDENALATIAWSVGIVLALIVAVTFGSMALLDLSKSHQSAEESRDVTVQVANAISAQICACVAAPPQPVQTQAAPTQAAQPQPGTSPSAAAPRPVPPCLQEPRARPTEPGWLMAAWIWLNQTFLGREVREPTHWQQAQASLNLVAVPAGSNFQSAAAAINRAVTDERLQMVRASEDSNRMAGVLQILAIGIGALTTMVVSLRAMEGLLTARLIRGFSIAAILLSALGTATAGLNSFYAPRESSVRQVRAMIQLKQLHQDIYVVLSSERCDPSPMPALDSDTTAPVDRRARRIRQWNYELQQIVGGMDASRPDGADPRRAAPGLDERTGAYSAGSKPADVTAPAPAPAPTLAPIGRPAPEAAQPAR